MAGPPCPTLSAMRVDRWVSVLVMLCLAAGAACSTDVPPSPGPTGGPTTPAASATVAPSPTVAPPATPGTSPAPTTPEPTSQAGILWLFGSTGTEFSPFDAITGVTSIAGGLVAVGSYDDGTLVGGAAAWRSVDGLRWQRAQTVERAAESAMEGVTVGPAGLVAVGWSADDDSVWPAVWASADGLDWIYVEDGDLGRGQMTAVAANALGYVALGFDPETEEGLAWSSRDGRDWGPPVVVPEFQVQPSINDVVALGDGFIAFGSTALDERAALWTSLDGRQWQRVLGLPTSPSSTINGVAASGTLLIAVGAGYTDEGTVALAWASEDGFDWQSVLDDDAAEAGEMLDVVSIHTGFLAVGSVEGLEREDLQAAVWWSPNGLSWHREPDHPSFAQGRMADAVRAGSGLVVLGERADDPAVENFRPTTWLGLAQ